MRSSTHSNMEDSPSFPQTPPYTPLARRQRAKRSGSSASIASIHPLETISPAKSSTQDTPTQEGPKVSELQEGDPDYTSAVHPIYPQSLEEPESDLDAQQLTDTTNSEADSDPSTTEISAHLSRLDCDDTRQQERAFERNRRSKRAHRRTSSRLFKRTFSQSVDMDTDEDPDALHDQNSPGSARRLRRRVRGPGMSEDHGGVGEGLTTPPASREGWGPGGGWEVFEPRGKEREGNDRGTAEDGMDVDES